MKPERSCIVNGHKVEEIYWHGDFPVYVDNKLSNYDYETTIEMIKNNKNWN